MRLLLAAAPLLVASTTLARSHHRRGPTTDTCAVLDADLKFADVEVDGKPYIAGHIDVGLCISQVDSFIGHLNVTEAAAKVVGVDKVKSAVIDMIKSVGVQCAYPPHAMPSVTSSNECDFVCGNGFLAMPPQHPSACICPSHLKECNGQCGHFLADCSVPKVSPSRRESVPNVDEVSCTDGKCVVRTCKSGFVVSTSKDACVAVAHGKTTRALPVPDAGNLADTVPVDVDRDVDVVARGSVVDEVPGADAVLGSTHQAISAGKGGTKVARQHLPVLGDDKDTTVIKTAREPLARGCGVDDAQC